MAKLLCVLLLVAVVAARAAPSPAPAVAAEVVVEEVDIEPPKSEGQVVSQNDAVTVTRYVNWLPAYYEGRLKMVPPGRNFTLDDTLPNLPPTEAPPASSPAPAPPAPANATANGTANATASAKAAAPAPKKGLTVKTYDNWQAAFLDGYGFPAAGQKEPKAPNVTNGTADGAKKGARRLLAVPREPLV